MSRVTSADAGVYVHCPTGTGYVWEDETDAQPIPNSIYNDGSGFTHDYYSGTTAMAGTPTQCLGVTQRAWGYGGPLALAGAPPLTPAEQIDAVRSMVTELVAGHRLGAGLGTALGAKLDAAGAALGRGRDQTAANVLTAFVHQVQALTATGTIDASTGSQLTTTVMDIVAVLRPPQP